MSNNQWPGPQGPMAPQQGPPPQGPWQQGPPPGPWQYGQQIPPPHHNKWITVVTVVAILLLVLGFWLRINRVDPGSVAREREQQVREQRQQSKEQRQQNQEQQQGQQQQDGGGDQSTNQTGPAPELPRSFGKFTADSVSGTTVIYSSSDSRDITVAFHQDARKNGGSLVEFGVWGCLTESGMVTCVAEVHGGLAMLTAGEQDFKDNEVAAAGDDLLAVWK